jgi:hypothetical protein
MLSKIFLFLVLTVANIEGSVSFLPTGLSKARANVTPTVSHRQPSPKQPQHPAIAIPRGGSLEMSPSSIIPIITSNLQSGPYGVLALSAVTCSVVLPLTLYKKVYGIGVAYGFSVLAAGYTMLQVMAPSSHAATLLAQACMFYGARLGSFLLREYCG